MLQNIPLYIYSSRSLYMDSSTVIWIQSDEKIVKTSKILMQDNNKNCVNYEGKVNGKLTIMATSMLSNLIELFRRYNTVRLSTTTWVVKKKTPINGISIQKTCIPDFDILHKVSTSNTDNPSIKQLKCILFRNSVFIWNNFSLEKSSYNIIVIYEYNNDYIFPAVYLVPLSTDTLGA